MQYYVSVISEADYTVYCEDEAHLREYLRVFFQIKKPVIYSVDPVGLDKILKVKPGEEVVESFNDAPWMTDSDMEFVTENMINDCNVIHDELKFIGKKLKLFKGPAAKKLRVAISDFFKERIPNEEVGVDEYDPVDRMFEKMKYTKYIEKIMPKLIQNEDPDEDDD